MSVLLMQQVLLRPFRWRQIFDPPGVIANDSPIAFAKMPIARDEPECNRNRRVQRCHDVRDADAVLDGDFRAREDA